MTTNFYDISRKVISHLAANFTALPIFTVNDDPDDLNITNGCVFIGVRILASSQASMSNPLRLRTKGYFTVEINTQIDKGQKEALQYADTICDLYRSKTIDGITYMTPVPDQARQIEYAKGKFYQISLNCPFWYDIHYN
jgi:hypothetical protein